MGVDVDLEIEYEPPDIESALNVIRFQNLPTAVLIDQERSHWEIAASGGKLCWKPKWRWVGRYAASNIRPPAGRSWRWGNG